MSEHDPTAPGTQLALKKRVAFSLAAVALFFGALTLFVSLLDGEKQDLTFHQDDTVNYIQGDYFHHAVEGGEAVYQIWDAQLPGLVQARFPVRKGEGVFRIFITGGSFIRGGHHLEPGSPPAGYGAISDWLALLLEARLPGTQFEVINAGANGQSAHRVSMVVPELAKAESDLIIIATGNNEGGTLPAEFNKTLHGWNVYRLLKKAIQEEPLPEERGLYIKQELRTQKIEAELSHSLKRMLSEARGSSAKLAFMTLPINYDGLEVMIRPEEWERATAQDIHCKDMLSHRDARRWEEGLRSAAQCQSHALAAIISAQCLKSLGRAGEAQIVLESAVQMDPRGRARPSYNDLIREIAAKEGLSLIDLEALFKRGGQSTFIDPVHLHCMAYLEVAREILRTLLKDGRLPLNRGEPLPPPTTESLLKAKAWPPLPPMHEGRRLQAQRLCSPDLSRGYHANP